MSDPSSTPRFLIRLDDGSEMPVGTVEALADHVQSGIMVPDTPLFDAGTGEWVVAGDALVVRFLLEEMRERGSVIPDVWGVPETGMASGDSASDAGDQTLPDSDEAPDSELLDVEFTLAEIPDFDDLEPEDDLITPTAHVMDDEPVDQESWISLHEAGGLVSSGWSEDYADDPSAGADDSPAEPAPPSPGDVEPMRPAAASGSAPASVPPPETSKPRSRSIPPGAKEAPPRSITPSGRRGRRALFGIVTILGLVAAGLFVARSWGDGASGGLGDEVGAPFSSGSSGPLIPPPPPDLEEAVREREELFQTRMENTVDSIRLAMGLEAGPAAQWLGGYYLANAGEFSAVREFWVAYGVAIQEIGRLDREHFFAVVGSDAGETQIGEGQADRLEAYLRSRYEVTAPAKEERYRRLAQVSVRAVALHDFLVDHEDALRYTPAVGSAVPGDPVLEVAAADLIVRQGLVAQLDALLVELDGARGGGSPPMGGIPAELFAGFGSF